CFGGLREREGEHAVLQRRGALVGIDFARQREAPRELHRRSFLTVHEPALRRVLLALAADAENVLVNRELNVILTEARKSGLGHEARASVRQREPREAPAPHALDVTPARLRGIVLVEEPIHAAAKMVHGSERTIEIVEPSEHDVLLSSGA